MSGEIDNNGATTTPEEPTGALAGERLAEARREKQISVIEIAKELHLDEPKVRALERNEFEFFGAPVFVKGHLRKYAQLVDVSVNDVMADYYSLTRSDGLPPLVGKARKPIREINLGRWLSVLLLLMIAAAVYWWFFERDPVNTAHTAANQVLELPRGAATTDDQPLPEELASEAIIEEIDVPPEPDSLAQPQHDEPEAPAPAAVATGQVRVALSFRGDCWTEITDANGEQLFFGLGKQGRSVNISGEAPVTVLLGDADNVSLQVNDADYAIRAASRRGKTARFTINNP